MSESTHAIIHNADLQIIDPPFILNLGDVINCNLYNAHGQLLARKGVVVDDPHQLSVLEVAISNGVYTNTTSFIPTTETDTIGENHVAKVNTTLSKHTIPMLCNVLNIAIKADGKVFREKIHDITHCIMHVCADNPDDALSFIISENRCSQLSYPYRHSIQTAMIACIVAHNLRWEHSVIHSTVSAAITANISMFEAQKQFNKHAGKLPARVMDVIHKHPMETVKMLIDFGVSDTKWLEIVAQHHEKDDGTGYPNGFTSAQISTPAKLVRLCDIYCAKIDGRDYRPSMKPFDAVQDIFATAGEIDEIYTSFISTITLLPPGSVVRLQNGEIGVVTKRNIGNINHPMVTTIMSSNFVPLSVSKRRDTSQKPVVIIEVLNSNDIPVMIDSSLRITVKGKRYK